MFLARYHEMRLLLFFSPPIRVWSTAVWLWGFHPLLFFLIYNHIFIDLGTLEALL